MKEGINILRYSIVMFAYNEENNIERSLSSIYENVDENLSQVVVIANGCTDSTVDILNKASRDNLFPRLRVVEIQLGDKCNAWNEYVHNISCDEDVHFFTDADVQFTADAFNQMTQTLLDSKNATAIAGLPFSGRNMEVYREMVTQQHLLFGNCYGLKNKFLQLVRDKNFYLPKGLGWIDSAITKIVKRDIEDIDLPIHERVTFNIDCGYFFAKLNYFKLADIKLYINRISRYSTGKLQQTHLEKISFLEWPRDLNEINQRILRDIKSGTVKVNPLLKKRIIKRLKKKI
ncbi:glycosyltransferase family A protein [Alteromonas sp. W364]|uniref:glycosyltransferase family A protein n=1 Tax=Alteromonas sp. W364 TaxID=3075610 RepID=UPI002886CE6D|nr:glycosyltransferase family A protein [Alteromonas sp. W364]MDT0627687.1 glycosyltransferase family A protein [Alteromonas sp. W364]